MKRWNLILKLPRDAPQPHHQVHQTAHAGQGSRGRRRRGGQNSKNFLVEGGKGRIFLVYVSYAS